MPSFNSDDLHVPQKFHPQFSAPFIKRTIAKSGNRADPVTGFQLEDILTQYFSDFSNQYRTNMLEIERWANRNRAPSGGVSPYDAMIDPSLSAADPANHRYPNLGTLVANESWSTDYMFVAGMVGRPGTPVNETGGVTVPGPLAVRSLGYANSLGASWTIDSRPNWNFNGTITVDNGILVEGISLNRTASSTQTRFFSGPVYVLNCVVNGLDSNLSTRKVTNLTDDAVVGALTGFIDILFDSIVVCFDCHYYAGLTGSRNISASSVFWDGGTFVASAQNPSLTFAGGLSIYFRIGRGDNSIFGTSGSGIPVIGFSSNADVFFEHYAGQTNGLDISVDASVDQAVIRGTYRDITVGGNTDSLTRDIEVDFSRTLDMTGPGVLRATTRATGSKYIFRGSGIRADIQLTATGASAPIPGLDLIGCDDSLITATLLHTGGGTTAKPYAIDANSDRSILIVTGANTGWGVAGTNASASSIVRDETSL